MSEPWTTLAVLDWTSKRFGDAGLETPRLEAQLLVAHGLGCNKMQLYTGFDRPLSADELARIRDLIKQRLAGAPLAYLLGTQEFWSRTFAVTPAVLVPRHDTEVLVETALDALADKQAPWRIAEVGVGSGAVIITLALERPASRCVGIDISPEALAVAAANAAQHGCADRISFRIGDLLAPAADEVFDAIVANLPYIPSGDIAGLAADVRREPRLALDGGDDGLVLFGRLIAQAHPRLQPGGLLALEHGFDQGAAVARLIDAHGGYTPAATRHDLANHPRVTFAKRA
ncbi:MAG: peptide chain release factor N(5)-glutamine methyltransferase [Myxococcales bacterium]|nr:peptide chain release factor N(5)-glutamine methyltransferase [Myxococcales bacterium]